MDAIILAGGMGTRLRQIVPDLPKPMAPVNGRPFLSYLLGWLGRYAVRKVIISAGYRSEVITGYFGNSFGDIGLDYAIEEKALGTGGAVMFALSKASGTDVLIINGDTWFPVDLDRLSTFQAETGSMFTLALKKMENFSRYGTVERREDTIVRFNEKKFCESGLINGGIYLVNRKYLLDQHLPEVFSLENDFLEKKAKTGEIKGRIFDEPFIDIGVPEDYLRARDIIR
ncbi:MAG TPA: nucleotidyltransferase family protein [Bacteroidales bacterium]|nr:nucleotidyltransferase family protein [Bacteroidales bacterium]HPF03358.1 nucleotidyltransferase family protein [Bacteroidales bacterium]HPJ60361.1 nucleotidyltransferase family protein [Bacteroidales bacterium]HPR13506.1 nucleotidyltransferase family protein [Bacteroidales bacterium]HRW85073.1 nucleotidyltransferase family protein [Bacteroidales bacterium]